MAYECCTNRCITTPFLESGLRQYCVINSRDKLDLVLDLILSILLSAVRNPGLRGSGEGIFVSNNPAQLRDAIANALASSKRGLKVLMESYIEKLELNADTTVSESDILYTSFMDNFPKLGD
ncbi:hypothetical protein K431DRAFT_295184 [Polychaeton citri CBS 116435]|uniref:Uncharacterized protein n=1 Tax=Polychaeton citri CBS 116435 TaxID=1314669 RepID=A0A9P4ULU3_9PEZI|nr:hypothetical protein K431DRAFT_295184 [Polychaeton citri CBS 116435]